MKSPAIEKSGRLERLQEQPCPEMSPPRQSLSPMPRRMRKLVALPAKSASVFSGGMSPEGAPAIDHHTQVAAIGACVPSVPWWRMPGDETEKCSMCKIMGMEVPCHCMPVALPLLSGDTAWREMGRRFHNAHAEKALTPSQTPARRAAPALRIVSLPQNLVPARGKLMSLLEWRGSLNASDAATPRSSPRLLSKTASRDTPSRQSYDDVRPIIGRSRALAHLNHSASV